MTISLLDVILNLGVSFFQVENFKCPLITIFIGIGNKLPTLEIFAEV